VTKTNTRIERVEEAWPRLRNGQERLNGAITLSMLEGGRFNAHLASLEDFTKMDRATDARFTVERDLLWKTAIRYDVVMRKLRASCFSTQLTPLGIEELRSLNTNLVATQDHLVILENQINQSRFREMRDLDILTSKDKGKGVASASSGDAGDGKADATDVLEGAVGLHVVPNEPSSLAVFPVLRWKDNVSMSTTLTPYVSRKGLEPQIPAGAVRLDEESMDHLPIVFHLEDGVPPISPDFHSNLNELTTSCTKWIEDMKDAQGSTRTKILKLGSSASEMSPQDVEELSEMARLEYDRLGFLQRASSILPRAFDRFEVTARKKLKTLTSDALEQGTTKKSSDFAKLWVDLLRAKVEHSLWDGKSETSQISYQVSKAANDTKKQTRRRRKEAEQAKTATEYQTLASKLKVQASEAATKLGVAVPTSFDELAKVLYELDSSAIDGEMSVTDITPTIITSTQIDWPSDQGAGLLSPTSDLSTAQDELQAELDKLHIPSSGTDEGLMIPAVPSPIDAHWQSQEAAPFLTVPSRKSVRSNSDVTSEHSVATTSSTALVFRRFIPSKPNGFQTQWYKDKNSAQLSTLGFDEVAFLHDFRTTKYVPDDGDVGEALEPEDATDTAA
jgi:hypothetical protein